MELVFCVYLFEVIHKKDRLEPLSSVLNLRTEVRNHTQIRLVPLSTKDKMSHVEGHHEISTSHLNAIELLPIWIMFIDRIIDRIWISIVVLTTALFQP